jgi:hypothetical protein
MKKNLNRMLAGTIGMWMIFTGFATVQWSVPNASGHVTDSAGNPLQLYSYYNPNAGSDITMDGDVSGPADPQEWDAAYVREMTMYDFESGDPDYLTSYLFLENDDNYLYIAVVYQASNTGASNEVRLYFDEGDQVGRYDGPHDDTLTAGNENMLRSDRTATMWDRYWDGANWINDPDFAIDAQVSIGWGASYLRFEWQIPLDPKEDTGGTGSDLNIIRDDELGLFLSIYEPGSGEWYYWDLTGDDPTDSGSYADLKLGMMTKERSFYATYTETAPTIDGDITNDFGWSDCYQRDITLSNFRGTTYNSTIFIN